MITSVQKIRKISPGLTFQDFRVIKANLEGITASTARKRADEDAAQAAVRRAGDLRREPRA